MADATRTKWPRRKPVDSATTEEGRQIEENVRAWYRRGQQALGLLNVGAKEVGPVIKQLVAEAGTNPRPAHIKVL